MDKKHILVVDDDNRLRKLLHRYLNQNDFIVSEAGDPIEAEELMKNFKFDMLILDVMMPHQNGFDFAKNLRDQGIDTPIVMLTAMGDVNNRITGLESGVDDYLPKPFEPKELLLRIANIFRRTDQISQIQKENFVRMGQFVYDKDRRLLLCDGLPVTLTPAEIDLLQCFCGCVGQEISREELANDLQIQNERSIDVQVNRLRKKIEQDWKKPRYLQTVRGKGYILLPD